MVAEPRWLSCSCRRLLRLHHGTLAWQQQSAMDSGCCREGPAGDAGERYGGRNMLPCIESSTLCGEGILETMHKSVKISGAKFDCEGGERSVEGRDFRPFAAAAAW